MPHARTTDPQTSHEAAQSVSKMAETYALIIGTLANFGPMNDEQLVTFVRSQADRPLSDSGIRSRRSELASMGRIKDTGERIKMMSGRNSIVWGLA